jgi:hypothetical protein
MPNAMNALAHVEEKKSGSQSHKSDNQAVLDEILPLCVC